MTIKVLNLYAGIGGNRKLWTDVDVTAVEINPKIADYYQNQFTDDTVVVGDAHDYLREHYDDGWDFIWASPPCQTHSKISKLMWNSDAAQNACRDPEYPDMSLYQEILFLRHFYDGDYAVENVQGYYGPLIDPQTVGRHYIWSNFHVPELKTDTNLSGDVWSDAEGGIDIWSERYGFDVEGVDFGHRKDQVLRNCVHPELGKHVFDAAIVDRQATLTDHAQT